MMDSSSRIAAAIVAACAGLALALAFPRIGIAWLAPVGAGALFWTWQSASWRRAAATGFLCGLVFYTISFWWWSTTIVSVVGGFAYLAVVAGAALESLAIAAAGALTALAARRAPAILVPLASAAAFAATEWLRSIGVLGVPFAQLGTTQVDTPLRALGADIGTSGLTFVVFALGAYGAFAIARRAWRPFAACALVVVCATAIAWVAWPARSAPPPTIPVAAIQGNITQSLKWQPGALAQAVDTYTMLTQRASAAHPQLILWPETVIALTGEGLEQRPDLLAQFTQLARGAHATIVAGSIDMHAGGFYNALYFIGPQRLLGVYDKRQLVPFAEHFPGKRWLGWLPYIGSLNGNFAEGTGSGVLPIASGLRVGALICWESAFGDLAYDEVRDGAQVLAISTDDAWFGTSSGPYQHAQIAQMRAIESGEYVVRAAATGISGVIAPDGAWLERTHLDVPAIVQGAIGKPVGSLYAHLGPSVICATLAALYLFVALWPWRRREA
jgi:apolipoprotein N-acyltransferase